MQDPNFIIQLLPLILIFVVFYFLLIRPQQKRMKEHREMLAAVRRGDRVVTGGGIIGTVAKVGPDEELSVEIAEGVRVKIVRSTITSVLAKTEPARAARVKDEDDEIEQDEASDAPARPAEPERKGFGKFLSRK